MKNVKVSGHSLSCSFEGLPVAFVNGIRRILVGETPILKLGNVNITENTSKLPHEVIQHRLQQLPINLRPTSLGWDKVSVSLDAESTTTVRMITTADFKIQNAEENLLLGDKDFGDPLLFLKLNPGEKISLTAKLVLDPNGSHASLAAYQNMPDPEQVEKAVVDILKDLPESKHAMRREVFLRHEAQTYPLKDKYLFSLETDGIVAPRILMEETIAQLQSKVMKWFADPNFQQEVNDTNSYRSVVEKESHTLGNVIRSIFYALPKDQVNFVAYEKPHPLKDSIVIRLSVLTSLESVVDQAKALATQYFTSLQSM